MRFLKYVLFLTFMIAIGVAVVGIFLPKTTHVERELVIDQTPELIFPLINNFKNFHTWSPWAEKDPNLQLQFTGPEAGEGATMVWRSDDPNVGVGSQTIIESRPPDWVKTKMDFGAMGYATGYFSLAPQAMSTVVTWAFDVEHGANLMSRYMGLLMDKWLGLDVEKGLHNLKNRAEALPAITTREVQYDFNGASFSGFVAYPTGARAVPGVLVVHEWWGHNDYVRQRAQMLAELGYSAFALDMYGDGKVADHPKEANAFMMEVVSNAEVMQGRFNAALTLFKEMPQTDPAQIAAIGYCFGGTVVLNMARSGAPIAGVASFHGALGQLAPLVPAGEQKSYLVLNGAADPMVTEEHKAQLKTGMDSAGVDYQFVDYPGARHAFTNPAATAKGEAFGLPLAYDANADHDSWQRLQAFLAKLFD